MSFHRSVLFVLTLIPFAAMAQLRCGTDEVRGRHHGERTAEEARAMIERVTDQQALRGGGEPVHTIPLVFHVVHDGIQTAPTNAEIIQAVEETNLRFQNAAPWQSTEGHVVNIQFCLASIDPTGAPTTGITRTENDLAWHGSLQETELKSLVRWDPNLYINVWLVTDIADPGIGGYAWYPQYAGTALDGIVMEQAWLLNSHVLVHELGHALGLYHTFNETAFQACVNDNCLLDGDQICDTPPDASQFGCLQNSCSTDASDTTGISPFITDVPELPNYMDYTDCPNSFSQDQADRMYAALEEYRWTLLQSNGCGSNPGAPAPVYSYVIDSTLCTGTIAFTNTSANVLFTQWDVDGGSWDGAGGTFTYTFQATGYHTVRMMTSGFGGGDTISIELYVRVPPWPQYPIWSGFEDIAMDPVLFQPMACYGTTITLEGAPGMTSYLWSNGSTSPTIQFTVDSAFSYQLTTIDENGLPWTNCVAVAADTRPPYDLHSFENVDTILCNNFVPLLLWEPPYYDNADNVWYQNGEPSVVNTFEHMYMELPAGDNYFWVVNTDPNGCTLHTDTFHVYNQGLPPLQIVEYPPNAIGGSYSCLDVQWTVDGVPIGQTSSLIIDPWPGCYQLTCTDCVTVTSDIFCVLPTGLEEHSEMDLLMTATREQLLLSREPLRGAQATIMDAAGRLELRVNAIGTRIDVGGVPPGVHLLVVQEGDRRWVWRWVKE